MIRAVIMVIAVVVVRTATLKIPISETKRMAIVCKGAILKMIVMRIVIMMIMSVLHSK